MRATSAIQPTRDAVWAVSALHSPSLGRKPCAATFAISLSGSGVVVLGVAEGVVCDNDAFQQYCDGSRMAGGG